MNGEPHNSPWGKVQTCETLSDGVFQVSTASHGGIMVRENAAGFLSPAALLCGCRENRHFCFEEDCCAQVVIRDLLDKKMWKIPDRITDKARFEESVNDSLKRWQPDYWATRQKSLPLADRLREGAEKAAVYNGGLDKSAYKSTKTHDDVH